MSFFNKVECCNVVQAGRVFYLPQQNSRNKMLVFLDRCAVCGQPIALIKQQSDKGEVKTVVRRAGVRAIELFNKKSMLIEECKIKAGTKSNMSWLWFDGRIDNWVRDFNNTRVFKLR